MAAKPFIPIWLAAFGVNANAGAVMAPVFQWRNHMPDKQKDSTQTWGYSLKDGEIDAKIFEGKLPQGWKDSPAKLKVEGK